MLKLQYTIHYIHNTFDWFIRASIFFKPRKGTTDTWLWSIKSFQSEVLRELCRRDNGVWAVSCSKRGSRDGNLFNLFINHSQFPELSPCRLLLLRGLRALRGVYFQLLKTSVLQFWHWRTLIFTLSEKWAFWCLLHDKSASASSSLSNLNIANDDERRCANWRTILKTEVFVRVLMRFPLDCCQHSISSPRRN